MTIVEELAAAKPKAWSKQLIVDFIGETGVDVDGLTREALTIVFSRANILEGSVFKMSSGAVFEELFRILGKIVAFGLLNGHPGPQRLDENFTKYFLQQKIPKLEITTVSSCVEDAIEKVGLIQLLLIYSGYRDLLIIHFFLKIRRNNDGARRNNDRATERGEGTKVRWNEATERQSEATERRSEAKERRNEA